jgi:hypothetical protein
MKSQIKSIKRNNIYEIQKPILENTKINEKTK